VERCRFHHVPVDEHQWVLDQLVRTAGNSARVAFMPHAAFALPKLNLVPAQTA
jgi:hypothetical protein